VHVTKFSLSADALHECDTVRQGRSAVAINAVDMIEIDGEMYGGT
jgi:hypothetical protein